MSKTGQKIIFNADDFGISKGVNQAVRDACEKGILNSASLMVNQKYAAEAVAMQKELPGLALGLHVNLTNEYPVLSAAEIPLLAGKDGKFKNGFLKLLLLSLLRPGEFKKQAGREIEAQINKARTMGVALAHIDGHRHVHMIPAVFEVCEALRAKYHIPRIRIMNENMFMTLKTNKDKSFLFDGGLVKYLLLRFFSFINGARTATYFYTALYTCKLSRRRFEKVLVPQGYDSVEIMIHPGRPDIDGRCREDVFDENVLSPWRQAELDTVMDKEVLSAFQFGAKLPWLLRLYLNVEDFWFRRNQKLRFLLVGGFNTVFAYGVYAFLLEIIGLPYIWSLIVQYFITVNVSILTMRYYVFQSRGAFGAEYCKAWTVYIGIFALNSLMLTLLVEICHIDELWAQGIYLVVSTIVTYLLHKYFSFYKKIKEK